MRAMLMKGDPAIAVAEVLRQKIETGKKARRLKKKNKEEEDEPIRKWISFGFRHLGILL
jgi:hypothetical protein